MPDSQEVQFEFITCSSIRVDRDGRQRRSIDVRDLVGSIAKRGVLNPIIVKRGADGVPELVAGERRLTASLELGLTTIPARWMEELPPRELKIIELEENIKRRDLEWQDEVRAVAQIHQLFCDGDPDWTMGETAEEIQLGLPMVSMYLRVARDLGEERVAGASGVREAYNLLSRRDQRAMGDQLAEILETTDELLPLGEAKPKQLGLAGVTDAPMQRIAVPPPRVQADSLLQASFLDWAPSYAGPKFNLIHCDFPYGINAFAGPQATGTHDVYDDSPEVYFKLLQCLCKNLDKLLAISGHLMFWYSEKHGDATRAMFREHAPRLAFQPFPLIWHKSDNAGIAANAKQNPRHVYETCALASCGARQIVQIVADVYAAPTDKRWHPSTKPEPMLRHFMTMLVDHNTAMLDPTCGGGSAIRAAESLGARRVLGLEIDQGHFANAKLALQQFRALRGATL